MKYLQLVKQMLQLLRVMRKVFWPSKLWGLCQELKNDAKLFVILFDYRELNSTVIFRILCVTIFYRILLCITILYIKISIILYYHTHVSLNYILFIIYYF